MPVEPPGADLPGHRPLTNATVGASAAAGGAVVLAVGGQGQLAVAVVLAVLALGAPLAGAAMLVASAAVATRWGSVTLDAVVGAQHVLGPGGTVGAATDAAACWAAAAAFVLATRRRRDRPALVGLVPGAALAAVAVAAAGALPTGALRVLATVGATALAFGVSVVRDRVGDRALDVLAVLAALASLGLAAA